MDESDRDDFDPTKLRTGTCLMLMLAYGAGVGGLLTPVGSPPNIIGGGLIEEATSTPARPRHARRRGAAQARQVLACGEEHADRLRGGGDAVGRARSGVVFDVIGAILIVVAIPVMIRAVGLQ